jgi:hypothetical protein
MFFGDRQFVSTEEASAGAPTAPPAMPNWFREMLREEGRRALEAASGAPGAAVAAPLPEPEKKWDASKLVALALAGGGLLWAFTYDPIERFPKERPIHNDKWIDEVDRVAGPPESAGRNMIGATSAGPVYRNASLPFASPYSHAPVARRRHDALDDLDELGGDGGDILGGDFGFGEEDL